MLYNILVGIILIIGGIILIYDVTNYKYPKAFESANFNGWAWGIFAIIAGFYLLITTILKLFN